jgi:hypothetical protein
MFQLDNQRCTVSNVNPRAEKHGDENVIAVDVNLKTDISADVLEHFAPGLKAALYVKPKGSKQQELVEGAAPDEGPALRFDGLLDPLRFRKEYIGYRAHITWGDLAGSIQVELADCKVHRFVADVKPGGSCELSLQIQSRPGTDTMGQLCGLIQKEITLTLEPPQADAA